MFNDNDKKKSTGFDMVEDTIKKVLIENGIINEEVIKKATGKIMASLLIGVIFEMGSAAGKHDGEYKGGMF